MTRTWPPCLLALLVLVAAAAPTAAAPGERAGRAVVLSAWDGVASPGDAVRLSAKLERRGFGVRSPGPGAAGPRVLTGPDGAQATIWRRDLPGRTLGFWHRGRLLGERVTDEQGTATLEWKPPGSGEHRVQVRFEGDERFAAGQDELLLSVRDPSREVIIVDIDHTLCHTTWWNVARGSVEDPPLEHAAAVIPRLSRRYHVLYVSARANKFLDVTRRWLRHHGFPRHPVFLLDLKQYPTYDEAAFKTATLARIADTLPRLVLGIGDKESDAVAYRAHGMRALILGEEEDPSKDIERVANWHEIDEVLFRSDVRRFRRLHAEHEE